MSLCSSPGSGRATGNGILRRAVARRRRTGDVCVALLREAAAPARFADRADRLVPRARRAVYLEQQLRALCGLPLAEPRLLSPVAMINRRGDLWRHGEPRWAEGFRRPGVRLHLYGKTKPRPGRKMGHLNCLAVDTERALALAVETRDALSPQ